MIDLLATALASLVKLASERGKQYIAQHWRWGEKKIELTEDTKEEKPPQ